MAETRDLDKLLLIFDKCRNYKLGPQAKAWLDNIASEPFALVKTCQQAFQEHKGEPEIERNSLKIISELIKFRPKLVLPQLLKNRQFRKTIYNHVISQDAEAISQESYIILNETIAVDEHSQGEIETLTNKLFEGLEYIQEEEAYKAMVKLLMTLSSSDEYAQEIIINNCSTHQNARYFIEMLLHVLNRGRGEILYSCLYCLELLFNDERTQEGLFYTNDFRVLIDIIVQNLENLSDIKLLERFLDVLTLLTSSADFTRTKHRVQDIWEACDNLSRTTTLTSKADIIKNRLVVQLINEPLRYHC